MPDCYANDCKSRRTDKRKNKMQLEWEHSHDKKISFHRIPQERQKSLDAMKLCDNDIPKNASLCSLHFKESDLDRTSLACTRLRFGAVPLINLSMINNESPTKRQKMLDECLTEEVENLDSIRTPNIHDDAENDMCEAVAQLSSAQLTDPQHSSFSTPRSSKVSQKEITVSPRLSENTPRKQFLRTALKNTRLQLGKKIKVLQQKQRRTMKRVARLKDILTSLKNNNLLHREQLDILKSLGNFNQQLLKRQVNKFNNIPIPRKYTTGLRAFALTLHFYSPRAYAFVRKKI
ncbi:hypothetical protein DMN91_006921 [Ooceraea biroi]|nr:uncharacterized protein LOC105278989 isoform X1 [Ooceraea biroi]XP_011336763.1 uncharacterized protein LOC105278989 isoform X1 [Ooceraea biroi]XP_011336764.1 uncharacterized protein LOC105278989 isoform X1 [Ooceraea biroi]RLU20313.1 hypothetical protein DMN91_006921 [Ooceraea biroi]